MDIGICITYLQAKINPGKGDRLLLSLVWVTRRGLTGAFGLFVVVYFAAGLAIKAQHM